MQARTAFGILGEPSSKLLLMACVFFLSSCSQKSISERDLRLNQQRNAAEAKRKELQLVEGAYLGNMAQSNGISQSVSIRFEIKDIPTTVEEGVDSFLVPILTGFMKIHFGETFQTSEYIGFAIQKAEYDPKREKLDVVVENESYKAIMLSLNHSDTWLRGHWTAPSLSLSGTIEIQKSPDGTGTPSMASLKGSYLGEIVNTHPQSNLPERAMISLVVVQEPTQIRVSANMRFYLGPFGSMEFVEVPLDELQFNPLTSLLIAKIGAELKGLTLRAQVENKRIRGKLFSDALGEVANIEVRKE